MRADARGVAAGLTLAATVVGLVYAVAAIDRLRAFGRRPRGDAAKPPLPAVTIMKPVSGLDAQLEANLRSFCEQDYPDFEVVFGVHHAADPALDVIRRVAAEAPQRTSIVVGDGVARCRNPKMSNVAPMPALARGEIFVISDSDMRVAPDYLHAVIAPFADPGVGAVTALFRGEPADDALASVLGAMCLTEQFAPSTLVADVIEPAEYMFGSTMAVRRDILVAIGGIEALGEHLADDFALGRLVTDHGYRVAVASCVVVNVVAEPSIGALVEHEVRWARTIRAVKPLNYPGIILTYPLPLALAHLALARRKRAPLALVAVALMLRIAVADAAHAVFGSQTRPPRWLIPLRDAIGVLVWARGLWGRSVHWRGQPLRVVARDRLAHTPSSPTATRANRERTRHDAAGFDLRVAHASRMAVTSAQKRAAVDLAALAYTDEVNPANRTADIKAGLAKIPTAAKGPWTLVWGPGEVEGILAYVALANDKTTYGLAFRGSLGEFMAHEFLDNWVLDAATWGQVPWPFPQGNDVKVSAGMHKALAYAMMLTDPGTGKHLLDFLRGVIATNKGSLALLVTGHSLGGALTQLASQWLHHQLVAVDGHKNVSISPLTFAAPTTGNQQFATLFETTFPANYALVNSLDIVPMTWWNLGGLQKLYPPPAQTVAEFGAAFAAGLAAYKDSLAGAYKPVTKPPPDTFKGWMPEHPDKFEHTVAENHTIAIYRGHVAWATGIPL